MDWARDQLGNLINAAHRSLFSYALKCPTCGAPVRRRAGLLYRAHFAHYSYTSKPECENYYPSAGVPVRESARPKYEQENAFGEAFYQGGLFLAQTETAYSLFLKLPRLATESRDVGELRVWTGVGERIYTLSQLQGARIFPVILPPPLVKVYASGTMVPVAEAIKMSVSPFRNFGNYFRVNETGGRLLAPLEPLEWGERYRLLTQSALATAPVLPGMVVEIREWLPGWFVCEVSLPKFVQVADETMRATIGRYLGRTIRSPSARAYFVAPPAHHIDLDGTHIFPETTERLVLTRTEGGQIIVKCNAQAQSEVRIRNLDHEWCEVTGIGAGDFTVFVNGREQLLGRIEKCELFRPEGVRVAVGKQTWEIFQPDLRDAVSHRNFEDVRIECPTPRVAEQLTYRKDAWRKDGRVFSLIESNNAPSIDAGNFGAITWRDVEEQDAVSRSRNPLTRARHVWIEGLVARYGGPLLFERFKVNCDDTSTNRFCLNDARLGWMQPHIRLAMSK